MSRFGTIGDGNSSSNPARWLLLPLLCVLLGASPPSQAQSLGFQITPDHAGQLYFPSMDPPLSQRWSIDLGGTASFPIVLGNRIFVLNEGTSASALYALDARTGGVLWAQSPPSGYGSWIGIAYENGMVFAIPSRSPGSDGGALFAFSAIDGHQLWIQHFSYRFFGDAMPTAADGVVYVDFISVLFAVRESDGAILWSFFAGDANSTPAVTADGVYVSGPCQDYKVAPQTGQQIWYYSGNCDGGFGYSAAVYRSLEYARLLDFDSNYGGTLHVTDGSYGGSFDSTYSPAFWQNTVFYTKSNSLVGVDISDSRPIWIDFPSSGDTYSCNPVAVNGVVYMGTTHGHVYGYSTDTGSQLFTGDLGDEISCSDLVGIAAGDGLLVVPAGTKVFAYQFDNFGKWQFVPSTPCRLVDTRLTHNPIQGGTSQDFSVPELGGCNIPSNATAYSLNVTVVPRGSLGYLTVWPTGETQPTVSNMNSPDGRVKANAAIVPAGYQNNVSVYASDTTDVILDVNGYFTPPGSGTYQFYPLPPCRIVDTRGGLDQGTLQAGHERDYTIAGSCGVPSSAVAYSFNVTVLPTQGSLDYLTVWPKGESRPTVSTLNDGTGTVLANAAVVPAGAQEATAFYAHNHNTDLLLDVNGYFAPPGTGGLSLYPTTPCRVLDTRSSGGQFQGEKTVNVTNSICAPPPSAQAYVFNATVLPQGSMYLTLWPDEQNQPTVSTLNASNGDITSNMAIVSTNNGSIDAYASGLTQLILDISGYFAP